jgi:hypothetical protein
VSTGLDWKAPEDASGPRDPALRFVRCMRRSLVSWCDRVFEWFLQSREVGKSLKHGSKNSVIFTNEGAAFSSFSLASLMRGTEYCTPAHTQDTTTNTASAHNKQILHVTLPNIHNGLNIIIAGLHPN